MRIDYLRAAEVEFFEAAGRYEDQSSGLGRRFITEVDASLQRALQHPAIYARLYRGIRGVSVRGFPYTIYFRAETDRLIVMAVFHDKRHPDIWRRRATQE